MDLQLTGQHALVSGGARGIGLEVARVLLEEGMRVGIADVDSDTASAAVAALRAVGDAYAVRADVRSEADVVEAVRQAQSHGPVDVLVNNAGVHHYGPTAGLDAADWQSIHDVNLRGAFFFTKAVLPEMSTRSSGSVICVASLAGRSGGVRASTAYASSKAGLAGFCRSLALELAPRGIRVNCVNPGVVDTSMTRAFDESAREAIAHAHPAGRWGTAREVADVVAFLASPRSSWVVGAQLDVNGGLWPSP